MNYLAHILLSPQDIDFQLGNLLADKLKGKPWQGSRTGHHQGLRLHGAIDAFTDAHPQVSAAKASLVHKGYLKGVVIDIVFDHFLSRHWNRFVQAELRDFIATFHQQAQAQHAELPEHASEFIQRLHQHQVLTSYGDLHGLALALERINYRLSERVLAKESATDYIPRVEANYQQLEQHFLAFFPELIGFVGSKIEGRAMGHFVSKGTLAPLKAMPSKPIMT